MSKRPAEPVYRTYERWWLITQNNISIKKNLKKYHREKKILNSSTESRSRHILLLFMFIFLGL